MSTEAPPQQDPPKKEIQDVYHSPETQKKKQPAKQLTPEEAAMDQQKWAAENLTAIPEPEDEEFPDPDQIQENDEIARNFIEALTQQQKAQRAIQREQQLPMKAESHTPPQPVPAQKTVIEMEQDGKKLKKDGAQFPVASYRPSPQQPVHEEGSVVVAKELAGQLGTSPEIKGQMRIDERKMAVLEDTTLAALSHFSYRYVYDGVRYWGHITEWWLTGSQGIGGLGRRHVLQALANTSGIQTIEKAEKPNAVARNIWDRNWRKKAEKEGKVVEE